eukprot:SAG22_NODE_500_length_9715_cov_29.986793_6_plen_76_part_00
MISEANPIVGAAGSFSLLAEIDGVNYYLARDGEEVVLYEREKLNAALKKIKKKGNDKKLIKQQHVFLLCFHYLCI